MKRNVIFSLVLILSMFMLTACDNNIADDESKTNNEKTEERKDNNMENISSMKMILNGKEYEVKLEDNETVKSLLEILPATFNMKELNGNEKYVYMDESLPTDSSNPKHIEKGDVMLYGNDCLVIFYKSFDTSYSYTRIGHIDNLPDLGNGNISVQFKK